MIYLLDDWEIYYNKIRDVAELIWFIDDGVWACVVCVVCVYVLCVVFRVVTFKCMCVSSKDVLISFKYVLLCTFKYDTAVCLCLWVSVARTEEMGSVAGVDSQCGCYTNLHSSSTQ